MSTVGINAKTKAALPRVIELRAAGYSYAKIARALNREGYHTATGRRWNTAMVNMTFIRHGKAPMAAAQPSAKPPSPPQSRPDVSLSLDIQKIIALPQTVINAEGMLVLIKNRVAREAASV